MPLYLRNLETGQIKTVDPDSPEFTELTGARNDSGQPVWEQTSSADADPETFATEYEVTHRKAHGISPLSDVTTDGSGQSAKSAKKLGQDTPQGEPTSDTAAAKK